MVMSKEVKQVVGPRQDRGLFKPFVAAGFVCRKHGGRFCSSVRRLPPSAINRFVEDGQRSEVGTDALYRQIFVFAEYKRFDFVNSCCCRVSVRTTPASNGVEAAKDRIACVPCERPPWIGSCCDTNRFHVRVALVANAAIKQRPNARRRSRQCLAAQDIAAAAAAAIRVAVNDDARCEDSRFIPSTFNTERYS